MSPSNNEPALYCRIGQDFSQSRNYPIIKGAIKAYGIIGREKMAMEHKVQFRYSICEKNEAPKVAICPRLLLTIVRAETRNQMIVLPASLSVWFLSHKMEFMFMIHPPRQVDMNIN